MMSAKTRKKTTFERTVGDIPALVEDLTLPPQVTSLEAYVKAEKERITAKYPVIKGGVAVLGEDYRKAFEAITREAKYWETLRELFMLKVLEETGYAKKAAGTDEDDVFAERRSYQVPPYEVDEYPVNAMWPAHS